MPADNASIVSIGQPVTIEDPGFVGDYRVTALHNGLTEGLIVRERIDSNGLPLWSDQDGGALPGVPIRDNITLVTSASGLEESESTFTLSLADQVSTPVAVPSGKVLRNVAAAFKVTDYVSAANAPLSFIPEISFFASGAADEFSIPEEGAIGTTNGNTVRHISSEFLGLRGVSFVRVRRQDGGVASATVNVILKLTLEDAA